MNNIYSLIYSLATRKTQRVILYDADAEPTSVVPRLLYLQFWPESLSDKKEVSYDAKSFPGSSLPIQQWTDSGSRSISFTVVLVNEIDKAFRRKIGPGKFGNIKENLQQYIDVIGAQGRFYRPGKYVVDINSTVTWLRKFMYPSRVEPTGTIAPPRKLYVIFPGTKLGAINQGLLCVMTGCDVDYLGWFPDGTPRIATVSLSFNEILRDWQRKSFVNAEMLEIKEIQTQK